LEEALRLRNIASGNPLDARMQDRKDTHIDANVPADEPPSEVDPAPDPEGAPGDDGWQQYRRWISKTPAPRRRRTGLDPALYTWKGYRDWAKQVKRNWSSES
jgi:hypothetical protein